MKKIVEVRPLQRCRLWLRYEDGTEGEVDLSHLAGRGVFSAWDAPGAFEQVRVTVSGGITWGEDLELCPDSLYLRLTGASPDSVLPGLGGARTRA